MRYLEIRAKHEEDFNSFPVQFAFNDEQLKEGLKKLNANTDDVVSIGGGGFVRKSDLDKLKAMAKQHTADYEEMKKDDDKLIEAIVYELVNHEYCITFNPDRTLNCLSISLDDERVKKCFDIAKKQYLDSYYASIEE